MIAIKLSDTSFEYDIYSLVKAFYPRQDVVFATEPNKDNLSYFIVIDLVSDYSDIIELYLYKKDADGKLLETYHDTTNACFADRKDTKNILKRLLYNCLVVKTGQKLLWGTLNGIRPIKIPRVMLEDKKSIDEVRRYMRSTYLASEDKIDLSIDIAEREIELMDGINPKDSYSIYIGIPFCPTTCAYCSFTSYSYNIWKDKVDEYLNALRRELIFVADNLTEKTLTTIYIGGGTPTSLEEQYLDRLLTMIEEYLPVCSLREYTIEAGRPDSITLEKLDIIRKHGITRISINPQTMNTRTLKIIGRHHTPEDVRTSYESARELGFDNINMDIIVGLPGEDINDLEYTLSEIRDMKPDSLTVHSLAIKRSARLNVEKEDFEDYIINNSEKHMDLAMDVAKELDMKPYYLYRQKNMAGNLENIGFATKGHEGLYNVLIMEEKQTIIALGAGGDCKYVVPTDSDYTIRTGRTVLRSENVKDPGLYIDRIDEMINRKRQKLEEIGWLRD